MVCFELKHYENRPYRPGKTRGGEKEKKKGKKERRKRKGKKRKERKEERRERKRRKRERIQNVLEITRGDEVVKDFLYMRLKIVQRCSTFSQLISTYHYCKDSQIAKV